MKILEKVKKGLISFGVGLMTLPAKVFGSSLEHVQDLYGPPQKLYGPPQMSPATSIVMVIMSLLKTIFIPFFLIIGVIVYAKKSKDSQKKKIVVILAFLLLAILLYAVLDIVKIFLRDL